MQEKNAAGIEAIQKALLRASMIRDFSGISHGSESLQKKSPQKERGRDLVEAPAV